MGNFQERLNSIDGANSIKHGHFLEGCDGFFALSRLIVPESNCFTHESVLSREHWNIDSNQNSVLLLIKPLRGDQIHRRCHFCPQTHSPFWKAEHAYTLENNSTHPGKNFTV